MSRSVRLVFLSLACFFLLFPLAVPRPGMPPTLKADEPAYYLMAQSLARDGDLICDAGDLRRLFDHYPHLPVDNLILKSEDGWKTVHFGKPYLYSLLAAPAVVAFGARGMVAFNMLLLLVMVWMGYSYLRRHNDETVAATFSAVFFFLSPVFVYVFWLQPEILNMFGIAACLYLGLGEDRAGDCRPGEGDGEAATRSADTGSASFWRALVRAPFGPSARLGWSAAALALAVYNKPMFAVLGIPVLWFLWRRRGWRPVAGWILAAVLAMGAVAGVSIALTGKPSAYLGGARAGVRIDDPERFDQLMAPLERRSRTMMARDEQPLGSFDWMIRIPKLHPRLLKENLGYFLWGRHTGLLLYMPFAVVAVLFFLINNRRSSTSWVLLGALTATALFFLLWIHYNWHGGSGFVGNRYFAGAYPAFLFLVGRIRPKALIVAGSIVAGLFLAPVLFAPYGAPVPDPTLQFHTRGAPYDLFPVELSLWHKVPGYESMTAHGVLFTGRRDLVEVPDTGSGAMWVRGAARAEIWARASKPLPSLLFDVSSPAPGNEVVFELGNERYRVELDDPRQHSLVEFQPEAETKLWYQYGKPVHSYRLETTVRTGRNPRRENGELIQPQFYVGAQIAYLGTREELSHKARFRMAWAEAPEIAPTAAGDRFEAVVGLRNLSYQIWPATGPLPVKISHRWLDSSGAEVASGEATVLPRDVPPRSWTQVAVPVEAPPQAGAYILEFDAIREGLTRFSDRGAPTLRLDLDVSLSP